MADQVCIYTSTGYVCYTSGGARGGKYYWTYGLADGSQEGKGDSGTLPGSEDIWKMIGKLKDGQQHIPPAVPDLGLDGWMVIIRRPNVRSKAKRRRR